jgi:predicted permease
MNDLFQDILFAWRDALKKPGTALLIVITLALGIGANSAMFSMTWHVLLAPLPYADGERLVRIKQNDAISGREDLPSSVQSYFDYRDQSSVFSDVMEYHSMQFTLLGHGDPLRVQTGVVSWNYFNMLGVEPLYGRLFAEGEDEIGAAPLILLSYEFWLQEFASDPAIVGKDLEMNNAIHKVIGVLPPMPAFPDANNIWITAASCPYRADEATINNRGTPMLSGVFAKLRPGITLEQGKRDVANVAQRLQTSYPDIYPSGYTADISYLKDEMVGTSGTIFLLLLGLASLVVLIASANVANLNLARMSTRTQELAIREAIGANPSRIARQVLTESVLYSLAGGLLGLGIAYPCLGLLKNFAAGYSSLASEIKMDGSLLIFSLIVALLIGIISGSASAFSRRDINKALKEGSGKITASAAGKRKRQALLIIQFALAFFIITASGLIVLSLYRLSNENEGYDPNRLLVARLELNFTNYFTNEQERTFGISLLNEITALPGVEMSAISAETPLQNALFGPRPFEIEDRRITDPSLRPTAKPAFVSEDYFKVMSIPLLKGRMFELTDDEHAPQVAIVNENFARHHFPDGNAIDSRISSDGGRTWRTIVGVVANIRANDLSTVEGDTYYSNFRQTPSSTLDYFVKSNRDPEELGKVVRDLVRKLDPEQAVTSVQAMSAIKEQWLATPRLVAILISLFGILALSVTLSGVIGVISYNISQRIREIGVHMAIGANAGHIVSMFIAQGFRVYLVGLALGLVLLLAGAPLMEPLLYETSALNFGIYLLSATVLTLAVLVAMYLPARRASMMSPTEALHAE